LRNPLYAFDLSHFWQPAAGTLWRKMDAVTFASAVRKTSARVRASSPSALSSTTARRELAAAWRE
jgi:hypothetical protein